MDKGQKQAKKKIQIGHSIKTALSNKSRKVRKTLQKEIQSPGGKCTGKIAKNGIADAASI